MKKKEIVIYVLSKIQMNILRNVLKSHISGMDRFTGLRKEKELVTKFKLFWCGLGPKPDELKSSILLNAKLEARKTFMYSNGLIKWNDNDKLVRIERIAEIICYRHFNPFTCLEEEY